MFNKNIPMHLISYTWSIINLILFLSPFSYIYTKREKSILIRFKSVLNFSLILNSKRCTASF